MAENSLPWLVEATRALDLTADDLLDAYWLAAHLPGAPTPQVPDDTPTDPPETRHTRSEPTDGLPSTSAEDSPSGPADQDADAFAVAFRMLAGPEAPVAPIGVPVRSPGAPALPGRVALSRALRPLKRTTPSRTNVQLDEPATVDLAAEADLWIPVTRPTRDRWLEMALVIDAAPSMAVWRRTIVEFQQALVESGAFRDLRTWRCNTDTPSATALAVRGETSTAADGRDPDELIDPSGRRVIIMISDCLGRAWRDGRLAGVLSRWGESGPVAVVATLPQRMWVGCAAEFHPGLFRSTGAGQANHGIEFLGRYVKPSPGKTGVALPVLQLEARSVTGWASLVSGTAKGWVNGTALFTGLMAGDGQSTVDVLERGPSTPLELVAEFRAQVSPQGYRLAQLLSAAPLSLAVMRLVQQACASSSDPAQLAEVYLNGLLERVSPPSPEDDPDHVEYEFLPGVRETLLGELGRGEALRVIAEVSAYVADRLGISIDFLALLTGDGPVTELPERSRPFARVTVAVLRALGGAYADKAERLQRLIESSSASPPVSVTGMPEPPPSQAIPGTSDVVITSTPIPGDAVSTPGPPLPAIERRRDVQRIFGGVPARNVNFTGRTELLQRLHDLLNLQSRSAVLLPQALYGLGGVGKTEVAKEYAYRSANQYDVVWWVPAEDPAEIRRSLIELAGELKLAESTHAAQTLERVLDALRTGRPYRRWLLIFDNAVDPDSLSPYLPYPRGEVPLPNGHVLITSRDRRWSEGPHSAVEVNVFTRTESVALLQRRGGDIPADAADELAERLDDLPLAIEQAAAWHAETHRPVSDYLDLFDARLSALNLSRLPANYPPPVAAAWGVAFDRLREGSPASAELLQLCAFFGPEPISVDMLWRGRYASGLPTPLERTLRERGPLRRSLRELDRNALVWFDTQHDRFQVHRLVQAVIRAGLGDDEQRAMSTCVQRMLAHASPGNPDELSTERGRHAELSPHIVPSGAMGSDDEEGRQVLLDQIRYRYLIGDYESSRDLARQVVDAWVRRFEADDEMLLLARRHLANTIRALGNPAEALAIDQEVLDKFKRALGDRHEHTLATARSVSADLRAVGEFVEAQRLDEQTLALYREVFGFNDPATLRSANNLAVDYRLLGDFEEARKRDEDTVARRQVELGEHHPDTLFAISNLVRDMYGLGEYATALRVQEEALATQEALLGATHPEVMLAKRSVAILMRKLGRPQKAREMAELNFLAYRSRFGPDHENTLVAMMSLCNALRDEGKFSDALELGEDALARYRIHFLTHPFTDICATNVAIALRRDGKVGKARQRNEESLDRLKDKLGVDHPYTLCCAANLASDYAAGRELERALELSAITLAQSIAIRGETHPYTLACANNYALDLAAAGTEAEAAGRSAEVTRRFDQQLGPDHPDTTAAQEKRRIDCDIEPPPT